MMDRFLRFTLALVLVAVAARVPSASAEQADREKPIHYQADTGDVNVGDA